MRAIGGASRLRRLSVGGIGVLLCCCTLVAYLATDTSVKAHEAGEGPTTLAGCKQRYPKHDTDQAACIIRVETEKSKCKVVVSPCIGTIQSVYAMDGLGSGDKKLIWATFGKGSIGEGVRRGGRLGNPEKQPVVWHSVPSVKIVAVFIIHRGIRVSTPQRIPTGPHSGHVILKWFKQASSHRAGPDVDPPLLLLEGTRIRRVAHALTTAPPHPAPAAVAPQSPSYATSTKTHVAKCPRLYLLPCIGPINTIYAMDGLGGGDTKLLWATRPTKVTIRQVPKGELQKQLFVCHTAPKVKIVAAFIVHNWEPSRGHVRDVHTRVPTGAHSCHITLTWLRETNSGLTGPNADPPNLILEGMRVRPENTARIK